MFAILILTVIFIGYAATYRKMLRYRKAYEKSMDQRLDELLEARQVYEICNRAVKREGLGEIPEPIELDNEIIKLLNEKDTYHISFHDRASKL